MIARLLPSGDHFIEIYPLENRVIAYRFDIGEGGTLDTTVGVDIQENDSGRFRFHFGDDVGENGVLGRPGEGGDGRNTKTRLGNHLDLG